jgi:hypothetical protein
VTAKITLKPINLTFSHWAITLISLAIGHGTPLE